MNLRMVKKKIAGDPEILFPIKSIFKPFGLTRYNL